MIEDFLHRLPVKMNIDKKIFLQTRCGSAVLEYLHDYANLFVFGARPSKNYVDLFVFGALVK